MGKLGTVSIISIILIMRESKVPPRRPDESPIDTAISIPKKAVEKAREQVSALLGCSPAEVIFTSGGSESNNHVLKGVFNALKSKGNHIITTQIEHPAIVNPCEFLKKEGAQVTYVGVDSYGQVSPSAIERAVTENTILISVNNDEVYTVKISGILGCRWYCPDGLQFSAVCSAAWQRINRIVGYPMGRFDGKSNSSVPRLNIDYVNIYPGKLNLYGYFSKKPDPMAFQ